MDIPLVKCLCTQRNTSLTIRIHDIHETVCMHPWISYCMHAAFSTHYSVIVGKLLAYYTQFTIHEFTESQD